MELQCKVQNYDWGKLGSDSMVAYLFSHANTKADVDNMKPYAELWIGTHINGPSLIVERNIFLSEYLKDNLDAIGPVVQKRFGVTIPFLLKILSIQKPLSIQAHPTKEHAEVLHKSFPNLYKDDNHKPELAIALTPFRAFCGFRHISDIKSSLRMLPELQEIIPKDHVDALLGCEEDDTSALKNLFKSLMTCDKTSVANSLQKLLKRLSDGDPSTKCLLQQHLVEELHDKFPGDVGCFAPYFLTLVSLNPGQAIYLKPNLPHAYLSGDIVECMASSDNVVRAGLTQKHIDVLTLVDMLDYSPYQRDNLLFDPQLEDEHTCIWRPPVEDFAVVKIKVECGESYNTIIRNGPSVIVVIDGSGIVCDSEPLQATPGLTLFLKASRQLTLTPDSKPIEAYQAICNI